MIDAMRRLAVLALLLLAATAAEARSVRSYQRGELIENPRYCSADGRFCLVLRYYDLLGDFEKKPAEVVFRWDEPKDQPPPLPDTYVAAFYDRRELVSLLTVAPTGSPWLVSDTGKYLVQQFDGDRLATIYRADGTPVRTLTKDDVLTPSDRMSLDLGASMFTQIDADTLFVNVESSVKDLRFGEIRIDLATGELRHAKRDIYPPLRVWATAPTGLKTPRQWDAWSCADPAAVRVASKQLLARATDLRMPEFPEFGRKARIFGTVAVELVVSETGDVICTRMKGLPFGFNDVTREAAKHWRFEPYVIDGRPVRVTSEIELHFFRPEHDEWAAIQESGAGVSAGPQNNSHQQ